MADESHFRLEELIFTGIDYYSIVRQTLKQWGQMLDMFIYVR